MLKRSHAEDYPMTDMRRELYLSVWDGYQPLHDITTRLYFIEDHMVPQKIDPAMSWLLTNKITGKAFTQFFKGPCKGSDLEMVRLLTRIVDNQPLAPLVAGKNFRV